jgi:hypothetical protein
MTSKRSGGRHTTNTNPMVKDQLLDGYDVNSNRTYRKKVLVEGTHFCHSGSAHFFGTTTFNLVESYRFGDGFGTPSDVFFSTKYADDGKRHAEHH